LRQIFAKFWVFHVPDLLVTYLVLIAEFNAQDR